jgi:hypothetical protein
MMLMQMQTFQPGYPDYKTKPKKTRDMIDMAYAARNQCAAKVGDIK